MIETTFDGELEYLNRPNPNFLVIRGPHGVGKSTLRNGLMDLLEGKNIAFLDIDEIGEFTNKYLTNKLPKVKKDLIDVNNIIDMSKNCSYFGFKSIIFGIFSRKEEEDILYNSLRPRSMENYIFLNAPLEVCIERDKQREKILGEKIIRDMYEKSCEPREYETIFDTSELSLKELTNEIYLHVRDLMFSRHHSLVVADRKI